MGTGGSATYTYDLFNRQKTHTSGGVVTTTTYRPDGLRHSIGNTMTNASGAVTKTYTYNAFGEEQDISNLDANPFRYCGEYSITQYPSKRLFIGRFFSFGKRRENEKII